MDRLVESSYVGAFYMIGDKILSNSIELSHGDSYGGFVNYSSHWDLWRALCKMHPVLNRYDYDDFPRGRVVFDKEQRKFIIFMDPKLNKKESIDTIVDEFNLGTRYIINDKDEHYQSLRYGNSKILGENISIRRPLSEIIDLEVIYAKKGETENERDY